MTQQKLLIVEDEEALARGLRFNFEHEGYEVLLAGDGERALQLFQETDPRCDLIILDLMLPGMSGYEICRKIRELDELVPILVLSARTLSEDKTMAFDCGTDQYMTKPFALPELLSRVRNLLDRHSRIPGQNQPNNGDTCEFGEVHVDFARYEIRVGEQVFEPTKTEMDLLRYFVHHDGRVLSRQEILTHVWGMDANVTTRTIDNFVMRLRKFIEKNPSDPAFLLSVRGTGYRFVSNGKSAEVSENDSDSETD